MSELFRIPSNAGKGKSIAIGVALLVGAFVLADAVCGQAEFRQPDVPQKRTIGGQLVGSTARIQDRLKAIRKSVNNTLEQSAFTLTPRSANPGAAVTVPPPVITLPPAPTTTRPATIPPAISTGSMADFGDDGFLSVELGKGGLTPYSGSGSVVAPTSQDREELPPALTEQKDMNTEGLEEIRQNFPDGTPQIIRYVAQDEQGNYYNEGPWRVFNQANPQEIVASGKYRQGRMHGQWRRQHDAGSGGLFATKPFDLYKGPFLSVATFYNGKLDGVWSIYDAYQRNIFEITYKDGVRDGTAIWWFPNRTKMREATFKNGLLHGEILAWDESEKLIRREEFVEGRRVVRNTTFYRGKQKQTEDYFLDAQLIPEGEDDWWQAKPTPYLPRGSKVQNGPSTKWYENNQPKEKGQFKDGLQVGQFTWWHANGNKQIEGFYVDGKKNRLWTWWYENGMKQYEGVYKDDQPVGRWRSWHADGQLRKEEDFSLEPKSAPREIISEPIDPESSNPNPSLKPPTETLPVPDNLKPPKPGETILEGNGVEGLEGIEPLDNSTPDPAKDDEGLPADNPKIGGNPKVGGTQKNGSTPSEFFQLEDSIN